MARFSLSTICLLLMTAMARADLDPQLGTPYPLDIILHLDQNPLFTPTFSERLERELRETVQNELGPLATVAVFRRDPLMDEVLKRGWSALDVPQRITGRKTHLVRVTLRGEQYEIEARQVDGSTGVAGPWRRAQTQDRVGVARLTALTILQDFGLVATVQARSKDEPITLQVKGARLDIPAWLRLQPGDVLALAQVRQGQDGKPLGQRVPDAVLIVTDAPTEQKVPVEEFVPENLRFWLKTGPEAAYKGRLHYRFDDSLKADPAILGYRALRLETRSAPLQLRVLDAKTGKPLAGCRVEASQSGFETMDNLGLTDEKGEITSKQTRYRQVVFVRVSVQGRPQARAPIPLVDDQFVELRVSVEP